MEARSWRWEFFSIALHFMYWGRSLIWTLNLQIQLTQMVCSPVSTFQVLGLYTHATVFDIYVSARARTKFSYCGESALPTGPSCQSSNVFFALKTEPLVIWKHNSINRYGQRNLTKSITMSVYIICVCAYSTYTHTQYQWWIRIWPLYFRKHHVSWSFSGPVS